MTKKKYIYVYAFNKFEYFKIKIEIKTSDL